MFVSFWVSCATSCRSKKLHLAINELVLLPLVTHSRYISAFNKSVVKQQQKMLPGLTANSIRKSRKKVRYQ